MWKHFIERLPQDYTLNRPIETEELQKAEELLGVSFPDELVSLLKTTDGINDTFGDQSHLACIQNDRRESRHEKHRLF
ncbi:SMI1/KNR4 family protein [Bacillus sp. PK6-026]